MPGAVHLVSKHNNGTLNLWKLQFQENSKYQSLVYVSHLSRACGHRFRVNFITSHPILPFLLTNSINELTTSKEERMSMHKEEAGSGGGSAGLLETFQKGMVIWGVEPVGPLCKTGGIYELARIDSSKPNAFENIAWFPCFLPSSTLGNASSSPSTLFASTDADKITVYQAVFDARTLLHDLQRQASHDDPPVLGKFSSNTTTTTRTTTDIPYDSFNVVSIQSTARPGCIIELENVADSQGHWVKSDLFHIYQEGLVRNLKRKKSGSLQPQVSSTSSASSFLNSNAHCNHQFNEIYFLGLL
jgi:hypothetical protein